MKKRTGALLITLSLLLSGCTGAGRADPQTSSQPAAGDVLRSMLAAVGEGEEGPEFYTEDDLPDYLAACGLARGDWKDAAAAYLPGARAFEFIVVRLTDAADTAAAAAALSEHLTAREGDFFGYAPDQARLAQDGLVLTAGPYLALVICADPDSARSAFAACLGGADAESPDPIQATGSPLPSAKTEGRVPFVPPGADDMSLYDTSAILDAYRSGDESALSEKDAATLAAAREVLAAAVFPDATELEVERRVYAWLCTYVGYDWRHQNPALEPPRESFEPYGALVERTAVCLGFAGAFQLLMDLSGIECITVVGAAFRSRKDHAWNMVRLDGAWYCVDATWDMGMLLKEWHYFNVTSDYMAQTDHQWDYETVPEAE